MLNNKNIELFYETISLTSQIIENKSDRSYLDSLVLSAVNVINNEIEADFDDKILKLLNELYAKLNGVKFSNEEIRKAMQLLILKGIKDKKLDVEDITPDTIGIFITYVISMLYTDTDIRVLDPVCGTSNLLLTIINNSKFNFSTTAVDNNSSMIKISKMLFDLFNFDVELFLQDSKEKMSFAQDLIVADFPFGGENNTKVIEEIIVNNINNLSKNNFLIAIIPNKFIEEFDKDKILTQLNIEALIKLPSNMFKTGREKCILVCTNKEFKFSNDPFVENVESFQKENIGEFVNLFSKWAKHNN